MARAQPIDNPDVTEIYCDNYHNAVTYRGVMRFTFTTRRAFKNEVDRVSCRLAMPILTAIELHQELGKILDAMEADGQIGRTPKDKQQIQ